MTRQLRNSITTLFLLFLLVRIGFTQQDIQVLTYGEYMDVVIENHPMVRQGMILVDLGETGMLRARGEFDPKAFADLSEKYFKDTQYYSVGDVGLRIPTWLGLEFEASLERNRGEFLNPERTVPDAGLWNAGVSIPVGQGLFIDRRRAELQKAEIFRESSIAGRQQMMNDLIFSAGKQYWDWFRAFHVRRVYEEAQVLAQTRFDAVKQSAELGDRPAIDTLEAGIQLQNRLLALQQAQLEFRNATAMLSVYLWTDGVIPLEIPQSTVPVSMDEISATTPGDDLLINIDTMMIRHPELVQQNFRIDRAQVDQRMKREMLKPVVNLKYNFINEALNGNPLAGGTIDNYTWGLDFSFPVFLRKERGELKLAELKIEDQQLELSRKLAKMTYSAQASINEWITSSDQTELYTRTVNEYGRLLEGERQLFQVGESSLFMVNARELGYINAQVKLIDLKSKNRKAELKSGYRLGILNTTL